GADDLQAGGRSAPQEKDAKQGKPHAIFLLGHPAIADDLCRGHESAAAYRGDGEPAALAEESRMAFGWGCGRRVGWGFRAHPRLCCCWICSTKSMAFLLIALQS